MARYISLYALEHKDEKVLTNFFFSDADENAAKYIINELKSLVDDLKVEDGEDEDKAKAMLRNSIRANVVIKVGVLDTYDAHEGVKPAYSVLCDLKDLFIEKESV